MSNNTKSIAIFLGETISLTTIGGLCLIVLGIVLNEFIFDSNQQSGK